jgi:hypothetical protein
VQVDSVIVPALPKDIVFDVAVRLVGLPVDFEVEHKLEVSLTAPDWEEIGRLATPIHPSAPDWTYLPGSEINHHLITRIDFEALEYGAHHLEFVLDDKVQAHVNTSLTVVQPFPSES